MYVEADVLYAYLKPTDWLKKESTNVLEGFKVTTSVITVSEIEFVAKRDFDEQFANDVLENLEKLKNLRFIPLKIDILRKAVDFRKRFGLNIFDAIHAATAFIIKKDLVSTDRVYDIVDGIKRVDPREIVFNENKQK